MDKQLEQRIRERAYELWMRHGSLPGQAEEYWYQAEREILGESDQTSENEAAPLIDPAPLGMTSMTADEAPPTAPKTRGKRSPAPAPADEGGAAPVPAPRARLATRAFGLEGRASLGTGAQLKSKIAQNLRPVSASMERGW
jgi:hypothetical protein